MAISRWQQWNQSDGDFSDWLGTNLYSVENNEFIKSYKSGHYIRVVEFLIYKK